MQHKTILFQRFLLTSIVFFLLTALSFAQIGGTVKDTNGEPVIGASVIQKGTTKGVVTDVNGTFNINVSAGTVLKFSSVGYTNLELPAENNMIVTMQEGEQIDEVVVVGFGTQKKASVVGAVQTISPKELKVPTTNLSNAFAGRIAGITSFQRSGEPGADGSTFYIRGISTFASGSKEPLIFIDGVEVSSSDMNALAPEVIESFSILKDATATALYGARGANGVMLITTRSGKNLEKTRINVRVENSFSQPTQMIKLANGVDYMLANNEAIITRSPNSLPRFSQEKIDATRLGLDPIIYPNVDWQDFLFKKFTTSQRANLNVTGGMSKVAYFLSASVDNDNGMLKKDPLNKFNNNINQLRFSFQGNLSANLTKTTKVTLRLNSQIINYTGSASGTQTLYEYIFQAPPVMFAPTIPGHLAEDHILFGNQNGGPVPSQQGNNIFRNPYAEMVRGYTTRASSTNIVSFDIDQDLEFITKGLKIKGLISFKNYSNTSVTRSFNPYFYAINTENPLDENKNYNYTSVTKGTTALGFSSGNNGDRLMNLQVNLDYSRTFADVHDVSAMVVYLQRDYNLNAPGNFYSSLPLRNQGFAGRVTYGYDTRYMLEANFGYNGSENFMAGQRFGFFPSVAVGYNISNEAYFEPIKKVVNNLKIRGSVGLVGNSYIGQDANGNDIRFPYLSEVNLNGLGYTFGDDWQSYQTGASITKFGSSNATWETGIKSNIGLDLSFFNSLNIILDMFQEVRSGIFMQRRVIPAESGIVGTNPWANVGKVKNQGVDLSVEYNKAFSNGLIVNLRGTFTYNKNTLLERDEPQLQYPYLSEIGKSLNHYWGLEAIGLYKDQNDIDNSPQSTYSPDLIQPGDIKYKDQNKDGKIDDLDRVILGSPTIPQIIYGFGGNIQYKGFDFGIFFQGVAQTSLMMSNIHPFTANETTLFDWIAKERWTEANNNPNALYPRLTNKITSGNNNAQASSYWLRDGSFLRLKNLEIGYTYKWVRLYLSGQNLLTFSPFKYWDPEQGGGNGLVYPPLRVFNVGLQFNF